MMEAPEKRTEKTLEPNEWQGMADSVIQELDRRAAERTDLEKQWTEVDRQVAMEPQKVVRGVRANKWIPNVELPLQAEALELLTADTRRLIFPADRDWFFARTALADEDMRNLNFTGFLGKEAVKPGTGTPVQQMIRERGEQDFADRLVVAMLQKFHSLYDFRREIDGLNVEAFKYGSFIGHVRMLDDESTGTTMTYPVLSALSIKENYLDDSPAKLFREGIKVGPGIIRRFYMKYDDLAMASKGSTSASDQYGGWMPENMAGIEKTGYSRQGVPRGHVELIQFDGDLVFSVGDSSIFMPGVIVTVARINRKVIRFRKRKFPFSPYITGPYHDDNVWAVYASSVLVKGIPIQNACTHAMKYLLASAALNALPPVTYDSFDQYYAATGGPEIYPGAQWPANTHPEAVAFGDPRALLEVYVSLLRQYQDLTGVSAPRLGAQTKSHQTAYAIDSEVTRGMVRTVDYVRSVIQGGLTDYLGKVYAMARTVGPFTVYMGEEYDGYVRASGKNLPQNSEFQITGAGTPQEERERKISRIQALQAMLQTATIPGGKPVNIDAIRTAIAREGGILEPNIFLGGAASAGPAAGSLPGILASQPGVPGVG